MDAEQALIDHAIRRGEQVAIQVDMCRDSLVEKGWSTGASFEIIVALAKGGAFR